MPHSRITLITGGNSGIGLEIARQLLEKDGNVVIIGCRSSEKGAAAVEELKAASSSQSVELLVVDVTDESSVSAAADEVQRKHGRIDVLVNNAGVASSGGTEASQMIDCFRVNAVGPALMVQHFASLLRQSTHVPRIVNISSGAGSITNRLDPNGFGNEMKALPYRVSKAALHMVFASHVAEFRQDGFAVFCYGPGHTVSNLGPYNESEYGAKPTSEGAKPAVAMIMGECDDQAGTYIENGVGVFPW